MLPEDRKSQGLLLLRSIAANMTLPHLGSSARRRRSTRGASAAPPPS